MEAKINQYLNQSLSENQILLQHPSKFTTSTGKLKGPLGDLGMFSKGTTVPVWKPSANHSTDRNRDGNGSEIDITRVCTIRINCPSSLIHRIWFDKHGERKQWDDRTCLDSEKIQSFEGDGDSIGPTNMYWLISQPKPMISPRDFIYAYKEVPTNKTNERLYVGCSCDGIEGLDGVNGMNESQTKQSNDAVRGWLQGLFRIQEVGTNMCDVTYCLRVKPKGSLVKSVAVLVANELVYTLFNLRQKVEAMFQARIRKRKKKKKKAAMKKQVLSKL